jgi:hypothetical protein
MFLLILEGRCGAPGKGRMRRNRRTSQQTSAPGSDARIDVGRHDARLLWQLVDEVASRTLASGSDALALDGSLAVSLSPGRARGVVRHGGSSIAIGLPLLEALPVSEVRALLAAALGSFARRHGRGRSEPGEGDSTAAEICGSIVLAAALVRAELVRRVLNEDYWPAVFHGANSSAHPEVKPFSSLRRTLRAHVEAGALRAQASRLFRIDAEEDDADVSLADRLRTLGVAPLDALEAALLPVSAPAAELLDGAYETLLARLDANWRERVDDWWEQAHRRALDEALGAHATPARTWTQATALADYRETSEQVTTRT